MVLALKKGEKILADRVANLFRGIEGVGGRLKVTNKRLIFEPHAVNIQKQVLEVPMNQIKEVNTRNTMGFIPNGIMIKLASGQEYKFVVWKREELIRLIDENR